MKTIPLKDVRNALMCARVASIRPIGRFAALTNNPLLNISCREARRGSRPYPLQVHHLSPMYRGDLDHVLERVRLEHGLAEVRRTWGAGMRALKAEFSTGVMR